jgi:probable HAF family extracellular repeat protein
MNYKFMQKMIPLSSTTTWLSFAVAALASISTALAQPRFAVRELPLPAGFDSASAAQINDQGYVVGSASTTAGQQTAVVWKDGTVKLLGRLKDGTYSSASAINSKGVIVGDGDDGDGRPLGWVTSGSQLVNFFSNNGGNTRPVAINDKGEVGGYYIKGFSSQWRGAIWTINAKDPRKSTMITLSVLAGGDPTTASAIPFAFNKSNQAAGWSANNAIGQHAVLWNNDAAHTIIDLGVFGLDWSSIANSLNDIGQVVGESHPPSDSRPILWHNDAAHTAFELPLLPGHNYGSAQLINNDTIVIGYSAYDEPGTWNVSDSHIVIWIDGEVYDLQSALDQSAPGWSLVQVASINNLGQLAGLAMRDGMLKAVVFDPIP